jgi:hypothetical protein
VTGKDWRIIATILLCGLYIPIGLITAGLACNVVSFLAQFRNRQGAAITFLALGILELGSVLLVFVLTRRSLGDRMSFPTFLTLFIVLTILTVFNAVFIVFGGILSVSGAEVR